MGGRAMNNKKEGFKTEWSQTWSWKTVINNKVFAVLILMFLLFLNVYMLTRISFIFKPIVLALEILGPPIILSVIFYYLLNPIVDWLEKKRFSRITAIAFVLSLILLLIAGGIYFIVPIIQEQLQSLIINWPVYWNNLMQQLDSLLNTQAFTDFMDQVRETTILQTVTEQASTVVNATVGGIGSFIGTVTQIVITLFTMPFILYYLLKDGKRLPEFISRYIPSKARPTVSRLLKRINQQVSYYVRGQLIVAIAVGFIFWIGYTAIGLEFALTLSIFAGFLNLIPYLGSFVAGIPSVIIAIVHSPFMLFKLLIVFGIEQILESRVISPQVIGNTLKIHPVNIIFILLISGRLFGVGGVIFGIPGYAIVKIVVSMVFEWYQKYSGLYEEDEIIETDNALVEVQDTKE